MLENEEKIVLDNIKLVYHILKKYNLYKDKDEYFDIGIIGLIKGVKTFNPQKNTQLSTYLCKCISSEILHCIRDKNAIKRGRDIKVISIHTPINKMNSSEDEELFLIDVIKNNVDVHKEIEQKDNLEKIYKVISKLSDEDKTIICSAFGILGYPKLSQEKTAQNLHKSQAYISKRLERIIQNIKQDISRR